MRLKGAIKVIIRILSSKTFDIFRSSDSDTVNSIKTEIQKTAGIDREIQALEFKGQSLEDDKTLSFDDIGSGSTVTCIILCKQ